MGSALRLRVVIESDRAIAELSGDPYCVLHHQPAVANVDESELLEEQRVGLYRLDKRGAQYLGVDVGPLLSRRQRPLQEVHQFAGIEDHARRLE